jgi:hypothetical protein
MTFTIESPLTKTVAVRFGVTKQRRRRRAELVQTFRRQTLANQQIGVVIA